MANNVAEPSTEFAIDHWEGFIGTCEPKILDASILPDLVITIYLTSDNILTQSEGVTADSFVLVKGASQPTAPSFSLDNIHATIEAIGLADSVYDNLVASMIAQKGFVEVPFKQYVAFENVHTGSSRFTVATQSLDRIWCAWRGSDANDAAKPPVLVDNTGKAQPTDFPYWLDEERYVAPAYNFKQPSATTGSKVTYQLQLNGAYYPQYAAPDTDVFMISKHSTIGNYNKQEMTLPQYRNNYFVQCFRLNMPDSEYSRTISGLDSRAVSLNGYLNTTNVNSGTNPNVIIFAECTSTLRIGAGRSRQPA